ncbi:MAG: DUF1761 domain-containing protein [Bacteroidota bacterium]|nr:DUF1761 domain-containing protein [Bacteroidota bacterium]
MFSNVLTHINWLHVVVAAVVYFALGAFWYSPAMFSRQWIKLVNLNMNDPNAKKGMGSLFAGSFLLIFILCFGLAVMQQVLPAIDLIGGIKLGLLMGICFAATTMSVNYLYTKKPLLLYFIDGGYHIVGIAVASGIISGWH